MFFHPISADPYERVNLASRNRDIVDKLMSKLAVYEASMIPPGKIFL